MNTLFPIFLKLEHRPVLVIGGGAVAEQKITALLASDADVTVISPDASKQIDQLAKLSKIKLIPRGYREGDVDGFFLVFGATDARDVQAAIFQEAKQKNIPVNIVDVPELCTFYLSSVFQEGDLKIAVSTNGKSPTLGKIIRDKIGAEFSNGYPELLHKIGEMRPEVMSSLPDYQSRKEFFGQFVQAELQRSFRNGTSFKCHSGRIFLNTGTDRLVNDDSLQKDSYGMTTFGRELPDAFSRKGKVYLIGAGPGDPELISVKGLRLLQSAEVVIHDANIHPELLAKAPHDAEKIYAGKKAGRRCIAQQEINHLLISKANEGKTVVRLKAGDPFIFGRGGEEVQALREAGIEAEVVPGITAGVGVPTSLGIPLTHRRISSSVTFVTGHEDPLKYKEQIDWKNVATNDTLVIYMGIRRIDQIVRKLMANGRSPRQPVAVIFGGTTPQQTIITGTLQSIAAKVKRYDFESPGLIIIGEVVRFLDEHVPSPTIEYQLEIPA